MNRSIHFSILAQIMIAAVMVHSIIASTSGAVMTALLVIAVAAVANGILRHYYRNKNGYTFIYMSSLVLSVLLISALNYMNSNFSFTVFFYFPMVELLLIPDKKRLVPLLVLHLAAYIFLIAETKGHTIMQAAAANIVFSYIVPYAVVAIVTLLFRRIINQRRAIETLNEELHQKVDELEIYSEQVRKLTLAEERNRMAQNLHDMLGHSLVALNMHIDVLNKSIDSNAEDAHKIAGKCQKIISGSLNDLRQAVYALKEQDNSGTLSTALHELADSVEVSDRVRVSLSLPEAADGLPESVRDAIYKVCKEAVTNSIRHGNADKIEIASVIKNDCIQIRITDNGHGADTIVPSNGITGMEERIRLLHGKITFKSEVGNGFAIAVEIPTGGDEE